MSTTSTSTSTTTSIISTTVNPEEEPEIQQTLTEDDLTLCSYVKISVQYGAKIMSLIIIIIESNPGAQLPNRCMASRHSTGFSLRWPGTRDGTSSMRVECAICGRGAEFSTGLSATLPDFSSSVFIALTGFPHRVFLSPAQWKGLSNRLHRDTSPCRQSLSDRLDFASWLVCPGLLFTVRGTNSNLNSSSDSCFGFIIHARWYFIELCNENFSHNYFHPGANAILSHGNRDS